MADRGVLIGAVGTLAATLAALVVFLTTRDEPTEADFPGKNGKTAYEYYRILEWDLDDAITVPSDIYLANPDGSGKKNLSDTEKRLEYDPAVSPLGKRVAFTGCPTSDCGVYTIRADGTDPRRVADGRSPTWSPDGEKIAFQGNTVVE